MNHLIAPAESIFDLRIYSPESPSWSIDWQGTDGLAYTAKLFEHEGDGVLRVTAWDTNEVVSFIKDLPPDTDIMRLVAIGETERCTHPKNEVSLRYRPLSYLPQTQPHWIVTCEGCGTELSQPVSPVRLAHDSYHRLRELTGLSGQELLDMVRDCAELGTMDRLW